jgi:RNA-directed DNA polymerase
MHKAKQFAISQSVVRAAFEKVKANKGSAGVDDQSVETFEENLDANLYKIWNRMSSGTYFPPPVLCVEIPKSSGGTRTLGVPTVADRVAQMVVKMYLEPEVDPKFHPDSYGYRPNKSALDAVAKASERCLQKWWVIDLDIRAFFDSLDHEILMKMVRLHTNCRWILLYIERWLKAPLQRKDGTLVERTCGSPQGSVVSPLLANIYLHHAFDMWMAKRLPTVPFERYADDIVVHCNEGQRKNVLSDITYRLALFKLDVHPEKTKIVYCKQANRTGRYPTTAFDFLGFTFRPRGMRNKDGHIFLGFGPAISDSAAKEIRRTIRGWQLHRRTFTSLPELARTINAIVRGWINYYGRFHRSRLYRTLSGINRFLVKWAMWKYKRRRKQPKQTREWLAKIAEQHPDMFAHWKLGVLPNTCYG